MKVDGPKIRRLREDLGMSARELAHAASISPSHLSLMEGNLRNASPPVASRLAKVLQVAIVDLRRSDEAVPTDSGVR